MSPMPISKRKTLLSGGALALAAGIPGLLRAVAAQHASAPEAPDGRPAMQSRAPALFVGHGSPMNAIQDNAFTRMLRQWGRDLGLPRAVLMVSAHWLTEGGTQVSLA